MDVQGSKPGESRVPLHLRVRLPLESLESLPWRSGTNVHEHTHVYANEIALCCLHVMHMTALMNTIFPALQDAGENPTRAGACWSETPAPQVTVACGPSSRKGSSLLPARPLAPQPRASGLRPLCVRAALSGSARAGKAVRCPRRHAQGQPCPRRSPTVRGKGGLPHVALSACSQSG